MGILKDIFYGKIQDLLSRKNKPEEEEATEPSKEDDGCKHDYVHVEYGDIWRKTSSHSGAVEYTEDKAVSMFWTRCYAGIFNIERAENRVCIKCGKCDTAVDRFEKAYSLQKIKGRLQKRKKRRRDAWAKQLWIDGCKNK